ncbi:MAG: hypothetical protein NTV34_01775 [Proteobacteria bacterium]|nr:hypothetical protein [Pseudomonadota bacterium]
MPHLITFETSQFDPGGENENPINPIAGQAVLQWLRKELTGKYELSNPHPEDWGWCSTAKTPEGYMLVGASADYDQTQPIEWAVQIHKRRGIMDKMLRRNPHRSDDPLTAAIQSAIESIAGVKVLSVDKPMG